MKKLLFSITKKDFDIQTFCSGGPGGQHQNKTQSGVRIVHKESGAVGESRTDKSQYHNKKNALKRLVESARFKLWINRKVFEINQVKTLDERVNEALDKKNLKLEVKDEKGRWIKTEEIDKKNWNPFEAMK